MPSWSSPTESAFSYEWLDTHVERNGDAQECGTTLASKQLGYDDAVNSQALQDAYLNFGAEDDTSASTPASSTTPATPATPSSEDSSPSLAHNATAIGATEDLSIPDTLAHFPATLDVDSNGAPAHEVPHVPLSAPPPIDVLNAHALRALLQASASASTSANSAEQGTAYGQLPYVQQGAQLFDPSLAPWLSPLPFLVQNQVQSGVVQRYSAGPPPSYTPMGAPTSNQDGTPVPQPSYQHGGYYNYYVGAGAVGNPKSAVPVFPALSVQPSFEQPGASLGSAKPLSASGRPNEPAAQIIKGGRKSSVTRHQKTNLCKNGRGAYAVRTAGEQAGPGSVASMAGT
ncbi:hypothetical protein EYR40_011124 [Pleurotus pulmonarius]|nr:hypothetical protein EYR36_002894 [Pleurotus pulmonarius]KAF4587103.1 hypothetical protein EYR40_011124 [Pleurotus pulmonarius]